MVHSSPFQRFSMSQQLSQSSTRKSASVRFKASSLKRPLVRSSSHRHIVTSSRRHVVTSSYTLMMMCGACLRRREVCLTKLLRKESCVHVDQTRAIQHLTQKNTHTKSIGTALIQGHSSFHCHRRRNTNYHTAPVRKPLAARHASQHGGETDHAGLDHHHFVTKKSQLIYLHQPNS